MVKYQIFLNGKKRVNKVFKTEEEARSYIKELKLVLHSQYSKSNPSFGRYLKEINNLEITPLEIKTDNTYYSVVESYGAASSALRTFNNLEAASRFYSQISEGSERNFEITETRVHG